MPIQVTCPKCFKRFQVSDQFAGKSGPCPNCKKQIKVPEVSEEVVVHAPDEDAPKNKAGKSVLKPIERTETNVTRKGMLITGGAIFAAIAVAVGLRVTGFFEVGDEGASVAQLAVQILGAVVLAPPLVWAGYTFLRDSELAPYDGSELRNRVLILSGIFAVLWVIYALVPSYVFELERPSEMSFVVFGVVFAIMIGFGAFASVATFEFEFFNGLAHAGLYLIVILLLAVISGVTIAGDVPPPLP